MFPALYAACTPRTVDKKRVFADRAEYLGDPDFVDVPVDQLLDEKYLMARAGEINPQEISKSPAVAAGLESIQSRE